VDRLFLVNAPSVVSEIIDGELIVMNLKTGNYYSSDKVGAVAWAWIEAGRTETQMKRLAAARYRASAQQIRDDLRAFFGRLLEEGLVREIAAINDETSVDGDAPSPSTSEEVFVSPALCVYTDMQDLLFLDPIHDVDAMGWPKPKDSEPD
jgi:hypothetical protein